MKAALPRIAGAATLAFALVTPYLSRYTVQYNRYFLHWRRSDVLGVLLIAIALALLMLLADAAVRRSERPGVKRVRNAAFGLALGVALAANAYQASFTIPQIPDTCWYWLLPPLLACVAALRPAAARAGIVFCTVLSPVVVLVPAKMLAYPPLDVPIERFPATTLADGTEGQSPPPNVYLVVFDEWSYERSLDEAGNWRADLPHLAALARTSDVYTDAHSLASHTDISLPRLLFQTDQEFTRKRGVPGFLDGQGQWTPTPLITGLFGRAKNAGLHTFMVGWYHPYRRMFGDQVDFSYSHCQYDWFGSSFAGRTMYHGWQIVGRWFPPAGVANDLWLKWGARLYARTQPSRTSRIHELTRRIITSVDASTLGVFHYPVPHRPFVFDGSSQVRKPLFDPSSEKGYIGNLGYMDLLLGELVADLRRAGKFDSSWLIVTSDHTWRDDPRFLEKPAEERLTHVPLLIKKPRQTALAEYDHRFSLGRISSMLFDDQRLAAEKEPGTSVSLRHSRSP